MKRQETAGKTWTRTNVPCLYRHKGGNFYARLSVQGKEKWVSLKTDSKTIAKERLAKEQADVNLARRTSARVEAGTALMGDLARSYLARVEANEDLKPGTKKERQTSVDRIRKTWPGFDKLDPRRITLSDVIEWSNRLKRDGTGFIPQGSQKVIKGNSPTSVNKAVDALRRLLDIAVADGRVPTNVAREKPPEGRLKKKVVTKRLDLPALETFDRLFSEIETGSGGIGYQGREIADFVRLIAFTGARRNEAAGICWRHVDWKNNRVEIWGTKTEAADRIIPIFPPLADLLKSIHERRKRFAEIAVDGEPYVDPDETVARVKNAEGSLKRACTVLGIDRISHHDLRHLFATVAIESGVDIPTVARWLGHKDGGALAMKTYGHLRDEHSQAAALKVTWKSGGAS